MTREEARAIIFDEPLPSFGAAMVASTEDWRAFVRRNREAIRVYRDTEPKP